MEARGRRVEAGAHARAGRREEPLARPAPRGARGPQARTEAPFIRLTEEKMPMAQPNPRARNKVVITCAVTGAIHTPTMSPHLPITADEIAAAAIGAHEAGAAIVHLHARDPKDGRPDQRPEAFAPFLGRIRKACNLVANITTSGAPTVLAQEPLH